MLIAQLDFPDPKLRQTLADCFGEVQNHLGARLLSVYLHGSVTLNDLAPGYSDLDFLAVVADDLTETDCAQLTAIRQPFRAGHHEPYGPILEGPFLPRPMLDPARSGSALCWGTGGERLWQQNRLGWFALEIIRTQGLLLWGEELRAEIPPATRQDLLAEVSQAYLSAKAHGIGGTLHSIDWLLTAARVLLWLHDGTFGSKSAAADWAYTHARGSWRDYLPQVKQLRLDPARADSPEIQQRLPTLTEPIQAAWEEVQQTLNEVAQPG